MNRPFVPSLADLVVDFPTPEEMAIYWAEKIELDPSAPYFGWSPTPWDIIDFRLTMGGGVIELMQAVAEAVVNGFQIVFFLGGAYDMAQHIHSVRATENEISMMSSRWRRVFDPHDPPKVDILLVRDRLTLEGLSRKSAYLGLLMDVTAGQPDDEAWVYFLSRSEPIIKGGWGYAAQ